MNNHPEDFVLLLLDKVSTFTVFTERGPAVIATIAANSSMELSLCVRDCKTICSSYSYNVLNRHGTSGLFFRWQLISPSTMVLNSLSWRRFSVPKNSTMNPPPSNRVLNFPASPIVPLPFLSVRYTVF